MEEFSLPVKYGELDWKQKRAVREEYIRIQDGKCCHCGNLLTEDPENSIMESTINKWKFPPNFFKFPVHLHHNHDTGFTIGAVHSRCNAWLWEYLGE